MGKNITIVPVTISGIGSYMEVSIDGAKYKSTAIRGQFEQTHMDAGIEEICLELPNDATAIKKVYKKFLKALKNTEDEKAYRLAHPEEFETAAFIVESQSVIKDEDDIKTSDPQTKE